MAEFWWGRCVVVSVCRSGCRNVNQMVDERQDSGRVSQIHSRPGLPRGSFGELLGVCLGVCACTPMAKQSARTSVSAKCSMSMITSLRCAVRPAILDAASPSTMILGPGEFNPTADGVHSLDAWRAGLAALPALLFGRAADANTTLLATQVVIFRK